MEAEGGIEEEKVEETVQVQIEEQAELQIEQQIENESKHISKLSQSKMSLNQSIRSQNKQQISENQIPFILKSKIIKQLLTWDEHKIGIVALCARFGYRADYFLNFGVTRSHVQYQQKLHGKNEITSMYQDFQNYFIKMIGGCSNISDQNNEPGMCGNTISLGACDQNPRYGGSLPRFSSGEIGVNSRMSYNPVPVVHVIRDGRKYLVDSKDLIVSDIVLLDARTSGVIPADIILFETSSHENEPFIIQSYLETLDPKCLYLNEIRDLIKTKQQNQFDEDEEKKESQFLPSSATVKQVVMENIEEAVQNHQYSRLTYQTEEQAQDDPECLLKDSFILNSHNFIAMGSRLLSGQGKGIVIKIGNQTIKGLLR